jgi:hypothetical protein
MDGEVISAVSALENRGAYVLLPKTEKFRDAWYFLPDGVMDTSKAAREKREDEQRRQLPKTAESRFGRVYIIITRAESTSKNAGQLAARIHVRILCESECIPMCVIPMCTGWFMTTTSTWVVGGWRRAPVSERKLKNLVGMHVFNFNQLGYS